MSSLNIIAVVAVASAAFFFLWHRSAANAVAGFLLIIIGVMMVERMIHTVYVFGSDDVLTISKGRFSRSLRIPVNEILRVRKMRMGVLPVSYLLIEYGAGHITSAQPVNEEAFIREVERRQRQIDLKLNDND